MSLVYYNELAPDKKDQNNGDEKEDKEDDYAADEGNAAYEAHDGGEGHVGDGEENAEVAGENEDGCVVNYHMVIVTRTSCL